MIETLQSVLQDRFQGYKTFHTVRRKVKTYGAILKAGGKIALVQGRYTGKWSFPKGHSNKGEKPIECTLREVAEETGIDILPSPIEYRMVGYGRYFVFSLTEEVPLVARDTNEIINTRWVTLEEMNNMDLNSDARQYIKVKN
jgi:8-oxo-dGTP pyrophosphatase MutT (NUDIX family)